MDKIYSRKRLKIPIISFSKFANKKENTKRIKLLKVSLVLTIAILVMFYLINGINPIIKKLCIETSKKEATLVSNKMATEVMSEYTYEDLVTIYKDSDGNIMMIKSNIIPINEITSNVAVKIQEEFENSNESTINLKLRKFYRFKTFIRNRTKYTNKSIYIRNCNDKSKK